MSYTPTTWAAGDTVTAAKLNKLEQGVAAGGVLVVNMDENYTFDKTWQEIHDASFAVVKMTGSNDSSTMPVVGAGKMKNLQTGDYVCTVQFTDGEQSSRAETDSPDGYPVFVDA